MGGKNEKKRSSKCFSYSFHRVHHKMKKKKKKALKNASTAPATNKSRRTPLCRCELLQIIKLIDCLKDLTVSKKQTNKKQNKNAEIKLDHPTRSGFIQSPNLRSLTSRTARVPNRSSGGHHESRIKQLILYPAAS